MTAMPASNTTNLTTPAFSPLQRVHVAEVNVIGRLLQLGMKGRAQGDYERVSDLEPSDFDKPSHQSIWKAIKSIADRHENISLATVENELRKALGRDLNEAGAAYLRSLIEGHYGDVVDSYNIIREASWVRNGTRTVGEMSKVIENERLSPGDKIARIDDLADRLKHQASALSGRTGTNLRDSVGEFWTRIEMQSQTGETGYGISSGLNAIDQYTNGFQRGKLYVFAGLPGDGKSALGIKIAKEAMHQGVRVGHIPLEMKHEELTSRLMAIESRIDGSWLQTGKVPKEKLPLLAEACRRIQDLQESEQFWYLDFSPDSASASVSLPNINDVRVKLAHHMRLYGADLLIVDQASIEAMSGTHPSMDEKRVMLQIITGFKKLAEYYNIPIVVFAQSKDVEEGQRPRLMKHLANSTSMAKAPDVVIFIHRPSTERMPIDPIEFIVAKHRGGPIGIGAANFIRSFTDFQDR